MSLPVSGQKFFIMPCSSVEPLSGRDEARPYGIMFLPVSGQKFFITPCSSVSPLSGRF
jgi:hypothetical protein